MNHMKQSLMNIKEYEQHEIGKLMPSMQPDEFNKLSSDIKINGLKTPIVLYEDKILDGWHRAQACVSGSIEPKFTEYKGNEPVAYVMSLNLQRRNLTAGQKAIVAEEFIPFIENERKNVNMVTLRGSEPPIKGRTVDIVAKKFNTSDKSVQLVRKLKKEAPEIYEKVKKGGYTLKDAQRNIKFKKLEQKKIDITKQSSNSVVGNEPTIKNIDCITFLNQYKDNTITSVITDPPFQTDVEDINEFVNSWLPLLLNKVKKEGRIFICSGAYPIEIQAYLNILLKQNKFIVDNPLIWTYRNCLGIVPKNKYNLNYQMIWHLYSDKSPKLDTSITNEMFSVQDINAPDGRQGDRFFKWQKPDELCRRLITHSTKEGDTIVDPFCGSGSFILMAAKLKRIGIGCDISKENLNIAIERGCKYETV